MVQIIGGLGNFDVYNRDPDDPNIPNGGGSSSGGEQEHGFEIEFESMDSGDLYPGYATYCYTRYGCGKIEGASFGSADTAGPGLTIRYYNAPGNALNDVHLNYGLGQINSGPLDTATPFNGVDHFGVHFTKAVTGRVSYSWLVADTRTADTLDLFSKNLLAAALTPPPPPPRTTQIPTATPVIDTGGTPDDETDDMLVSFITNGVRGDQAVYVLRRENANPDVDDNDGDEADESDLDDLLNTDGDFDPNNPELVDLNLDLDFELMAGGEQLGADDRDDIVNDTLQQIYDVYGFVVDGTVTEAQLDDGFDIPGNWRCYYIRKDDGELDPNITEDANGSTDYAANSVDAGGCRGDLITTMMTATNTALDTARLVDAAPAANNVPEPAALSLPGLGLPGLGLLGLARMRRATALALRGA